uniref:Nucleocapsid protein n=1 Tax=Coleopteran phasma-related virus OKIAV243 TaxID=2746312 RepID=A0A7D7J2D1_9VIRU|nr:nucleocapsid protein [Coleopteran phasma-related virus OKIAV243]
MTTKSITFPGALRELGIDDEDSSAATTFKTEGTLPGSIIQHTVSKEYIMLGVTPADFIKKHGATALDFAGIVSHFKLICEDFMDTLQMDVRSKAVEFCSKMIYEVGPEARQIRKKDSDKTWKFLFMYKVENRLVVKVAFVSTYKKEESEYVLEKSNTKITLSVKTASLLALLVLEQLNELGVNQPDPICLLTPLAGAVFSREDIPAIAQLRNRTAHQVLNTINASCQSGGFNLPCSNAAVAAVAAIVATRNVKDERMKNGIIGKTLKQYLMHKKTWNDRVFETYAKFGHGGVPANLAPENLIRLFDDIHKVSPVIATIAAKQTAQKSQVMAPRDQQDAYAGTSRVKGGPPTP